MFNLIFFALFVVQVVANCNAFLFGLKNNSTKNLLIYTFIKVELNSLNIKKWNQKISIRIMMLTFEVYLTLVFHLD
jgi:hypothetical protein